MLDLFLKLIDRCIDLAKRREQVNKNFYTEFIAPTFSDFEAVHNNYMGTFLRYREMLSDGKVKLDNKHPVIDLISRDSLFSNNLRAKIMALPYEASNPIVQEFTKAIAVYLGNVAVYELKFQDEPEGINIKDIKKIRYELGVAVKLWLMSYNCKVRYHFKEGIVEILKESVDQEVKRKRAVEVLDNFVAIAQVNYMAVLREHSKLKNQLLKSK
jgi:hypothetical protein